MSYTVQTLEQENTWPAGRCDDNN